MKIAIFLPNWIGDVVMATPALRAVRNQFANAEIVGVMRPYVADVLDGLDLIDRNLFHNPRGDSVEQKGRRFISALRREKFDTALLLPNSLRSAWNARLSGAKQRIGFARDGRSWLLTHKVSRKPKTVPHPALVEYLRLAEVLGCNVSSRQTELAVTTRDESVWQQFVDKQTADFNARPLVTINPGGAFGAAKHYPTESFGRVANRIAENHGASVLVVCGPAERDEARSIVQSANHAYVRHLADETPSIGLTKAAIKNSRLLVTTDSGPRHFAQPFDVPVVTLFGPTHIAWSETFYDRGIHLQLDMDCGPCQQRVCPLQHHKCMKDLTVGRVMRAVSTMLDPDQRAVA